MSTTTLSASETRSQGRGDGQWSQRQLIAIGLVVLAIALAMARSLLPEWTIVRVEEGLFPYAVWLDAVFNFVRDDLGLIHLTRAIAGGLEYLLDATANLLYGKRRWPHLGPIPWTALAAAGGVTPSP